MNVKQVKVTEVGPRDGFQSEKTIKGAVPPQCRYLFYGCVPELD